MKIRTNLTEALVEGRDLPIRYTVNLTAPGMHYTPMQWRTRPQGQIPSYGAPTNANLAKFMAKFLETMKPGGHSAHLGDKGIPTRATIMDHDTGQVVASWINPEH